MTPFLKIVAQDLYDRFGGELHNVAVVFPNKRASLFFNEYLMQISGKAMWSPVYITISELFEQSTQAAIGDPILLVSKLYKEYVHHTHSTESIDSFYSWGELLIKVQKRNSYYSEMQSFLLFLHRHLIHKHYLRQ